MSYSSATISRVSYGEVAETCPHIDKALEAASEAIKVQTGLLRDSLSEWIERAMNAEDELSSANELIENLESQISELEAKLASIGE